MKTVVVIPTYNEKDTIELIIRKVFEIEPNLNILVVDDNSPDGTQVIVDKLIKEYPNLSIMRRNGKEGLGRAYISAFIELIKDTKIDTVITMDADYSHDPIYIPYMLEKRNEYDIVVGSRYIKHGGTLGWEMWRRILSYGGNFYTRCITRIPIKDVTAGFIAISTRILRNIDLRHIGSSGYAFTIELKYFLFKSGAKIVEIPIIFKNRIIGESKISNHIVSEGLKAPWRLVFRKSIININCNVCNEMPHTKYAHKNTYTVYQCIQCKTLKIHPIPSNCKDIYCEDYFSGASQGFGYVDYEADKEAMKNVFIKYTQYIDRYFYSKNTKNRSNKLLLDIGAATGYFMKIAIDAGYKVTGIDISAVASEKGKKNGLNIFPGTIETFYSRSKKFNVITLLDVLEHVEDPRRHIKLCAKMLDKDGIIVINTPDSGSPFARLLGKRWHLIVPPEHIYYFNRKSLIKLLDEEGFEIVTSTTIGKNFTLEYIFLTLGKFSNLKIFFRFALFLKKYPKLAHISLPINLRDNMFIIAKIKRT